MNVAAAIMAGFDVQRQRDEVALSLQEIERRLDRYTDMPACHISCETTHGQQPS